MPVSLMLDRNFWPSLTCAASMTKEEKDVVMEHVTVNVGDLYEKLGPMLPETISVLNEFYEPFNQQLAQLLDDEQFLWRDITP